jgi:predicted site-specific integrase-resolvase
MVGLVNLKEWAREQGVAYVTARRWYASGTLPVPAFRVGGLILIGEPVAGALSSGVTVVYAGVSSADQRGDLDRQVARVAAWATGQQVSVDRVVTEVGSALNGQRRKLLGLLRDPVVSTIVVEHRERFARFGAEYVEAALAGSGRRLLVVDPSGVDDEVDSGVDGDLVGDVTQILTGLCARLYGRRGAANRAARAVGMLGQDFPG